MGKMSSTTAARTLALTTPRLGESGGSMGGGDEQLYAPWFLVPAMVGLM